MHLIPLIVFFVFAAVLWAIVFQAERWRVNAIQALAARQGLHYLGEALPRSLSLQGTPFQRVTRVWNVVDGEPRGVRVVAFDCQVGRGKGRWRRTVIAIEKGEDLSQTLSLSSSMTADSVGHWKLMYHAKEGFDFRVSGLMPVEEVESWLSSVAKIESPERG